MREDPRTPAVTIDADAWSARDRRNLHDLPTHLLEHARLPSERATPAGAPKPP